MIFLLKYVLSEKYDIGTLKNDLKKHRHVYIEVISGVRSFYKMHQVWTSCAGQLALVTSAEPAHSAKIAQALVTSAPHRRHTSARELGDHWAICAGEISRVTSA